MKLSCAGAAFWTVMVMTASLNVAVVVATNSAAMFVFGDSLADYGNNNHLITLAKANFKPYGIDMPNKVPTGRYCNGLLVSDFISEFMGKKSVLPFLDPNAKGEELQRGVNFASAGAGILIDTGAIFNQRLELPMQLQCFQNVCQRLASSMGEDAANALISNGIYLISVGSNDYINNYLLPFSNRIKDLGLVQFQNLLITTLHQHIRALYAMGARKIAVSNIGPLGCIPAQLALRSRNGSCVRALNRIAVSFNWALKRMLTDFNRHVPDAHVLYVDTFRIMMAYISVPGAGGFKHRNVACCGMGPYRGLVTCNPLAPVCANRTEYLFWDPFHPTEAFNLLYAQRVMYGSVEDISPMNIQQLLAL